MVTNRSDFVNQLTDQIGPTDSGLYLRPFVSDGLPSECPVVFIGYNAATAIPVSEIDKNEYCGLLLDRPRFEEFYSDYRMRRKQAEGKRPQQLSTTRKRLGIIREAYTGQRIIETNLNSYPTKDVSALKKLPTKQFQLGQQVSEWVFHQLSPSVILLYGDEFKIPQDFSGVEMKILTSPKDIHEWVTVYPLVSWMDKEVKMFWIKRHLAARGSGINDELFRGIGKICADWNG
jgi:hypothetical protein